MSAHANAALARMIYEAFNNNDFEAILTYTSEDVEVVLIPFDQHFHGLEGFREFMQSFKLAFPDCTANLVNQIASEDRVVNELIAQGTHTGPLFGPQGEIPASGKSVDVPFCDVWQIKDGKLSRLHSYFDSATMMGQLG